MRMILAVTLVVSAVPAAAMAQDFGTDWVDRVLQERMADRGPLKPAPVAFTTAGGVAAYWDNNVYLEDDEHENTDVVIVPFAGARLTYSESQFEAIGDMLLDYKRYVDEDSARDWEQRFFGRVRWLGARMTAGVTTVLQNLSDPTDAVFIERVERVVWDVIPSFTYDITRTVAFEAEADAQLIRFQDSVFRDSENNNYRFIGSFVYRSPGGFDWLLQGGYIMIDYTEKQSVAGIPAVTSGTPDAEGYLVRGGFRGQPSERLSLEVLAGFAHITSMDFEPTEDRVSENGVDVLARLRYEFLSNLKGTADYSREFTFSGAGEPYQLVNRFIGGLEFEPVSGLTLKGRVQYDTVDTALGVEREFLAAGGSASYRVAEFLVIEGGGTVRVGETHGDVVTAVDFDNVIFHFGFVFNY
jgi:hypothetical protein